MQALYQADFGSFKIEEALSNLYEQQEISEETKKFAEILARGAWNSVKESDEIIKKYLKGWKIERIGGVDRSILRLSIYELKDIGTPIQVVIDEAVELAKKFSAEDSPKFINGVLGAYLKDIKK